jgi:hypothetical protein
LAACMACAVFLAMAVAALAWGTARGDDHVVAGCDEKKTGSLRVVEGHDRCSRNTIRVSWSRTGPKGGPGSIDPAGPAGNAGATGRAGAPEELGDRGADGASGPADAQGDIGPDGEYAADGDECAIGAAGPCIARKAPRGYNGAPSARVDSGHARAPPASLSAPRTGPGA